MDDMRRAAFETVARACGFASLGIFCVMFGLSFDPRFAFKAGGFLTTAVALILMFKAREAQTKASRPPAALAQRLSATVLRETYLSFALWASAIAVCLWAAALAFALAGR
jgi:hypothetical protein